MRNLNVLSRGKPIVLAALAVLVVVSGRLAAANPEKKDASTEKQIAFAMDGKPWDAVFKWLANETGKPVTPTQTDRHLSFIGKDTKTYTLPEVIDIINGGLLSASQTQKYHLVNGEQAFTLVPADEKIDPALLPKVTQATLAKHGDTELVQMKLPLTSLNAEDMAPRIGPIMGPFHEAVALPGNRLVLQDTVRNLKRVVDTLKEIEESGKTQTDTYSHDCKYILARDAETISGSCWASRRRRNKRSRKAVRQRRPAVNAVTPSSPRRMAFPDRAGSGAAVSLEGRGETRGERRETRRGDRPDNAEPRRRRRTRGAVAAVAVSAGVFRTTAGQFYITSDDAKNLHPGHRAAGDHRQGQGHRREPSRQGGAGADADPHRPAVVQDHYGARRQRRIAGQGLAGHLSAFFHAAHHVGRPQRPPRLRLPEDMDRFRNSLRSRQGRQRRAGRRGQLWIPRKPRPRCKPCSATPKPAARTSRRRPTRTPSLSAAPPTGRRSIRDTIKVMNGEDGVGRTSGSADV